MIHTREDVWLFGIGIAYPVVLFGHMFLCGTIPWWLVENPAMMVLMVYVLPAISAIVLTVMRCMGFPFSRVAIPAFAIWLGLLHWLFLRFLEELSGAV